MGQLICRNKKYSPDENDNGDKISKSQNQGSIPKSASRCPSVEDQRTRQENAGRVPGTPRQNAFLGNAVNVYGSDEVPDEASQRNIVKEQTVNGSDEVSQKNIVKEQTVNGSDEVSQKNIVKEQTVNGSDEVSQKNTVKGRREYSRQKNISTGGPRGSIQKSAKCHSCGDSQRETQRDSRHEIQTAYRQEFPKPIPNVVKTSSEEKLRRAESPLVSSSKGGYITFTRFFSILDDVNQCNCSDASIEFSSSNISTESESKCQIYSNVIEHTLERAVRKRGLPQLTNQIHITKPLPSCLEKLKHCSHFRSLFRKIGKLAFASLINNKKGHIMDEEITGKYLTQEELKLCLDFDLLYQERNNKDSCSQKTMHEFFAALYLYFAGQKVLDLMVKKCVSLSALLEVSDIFVFISGFDLELYYELSCRIVDTVMEDKSIERYRKSCYYDEDGDFKLVLNFQNLQTECAREMELTGHNVPPMPLQDIIINKDTKNNDTLSLVQKITHTCPENIKSLYIYECETTKEVAEILKRINFHSLQRLQKLFLPYVLELHEEQILFGPQTKLQTLSLVNIFNFGDRYVRHPAVLSPCFREYLQNMSKLQALYLDTVSLDDAQLQQIVMIITLRNSMTRIGLYKIGNHDMNRVELDLSHHTKLVQLHLHDVPVSQVNLNTQHLEEIVIGGLAPNVVKSLLRCLPEARLLQRLSCNHFKDDTVADMVATIPTLVQLESLHIQSTDIDDRLFLLSPEMTRLRRIELLRVSLRSTVLEDLAITLRNLSLSVTVHLNECVVTSTDGFQTLRNIMKSSKQFIVLTDRLDSNDFLIYSFKTNP